MNVTTIYNGSSSEVTEMRLATVEANFQEVGYMVIFRLEKWKGDVTFQIRHQFGADEIPMLKKIIEIYNECTGQKESLEKWKARRLRGTRSKSGLGELYLNGGTFNGMCAYDAETFSKRLAEFLSDWHAEKWKWVCIEATKMGGWEE